MIIIGYQGIGKSTLAGKNKFIDLESGNFWNEGQRPYDWYVYYCNIANDLSNQGYKVCVASHKAVRNRLSKYSTEQLFTVTPDLTLKDEWILKLKTRWESTGLDKDYKAYANALDCYEDNIIDILATENCQHIIIESMNYDLNDMLFAL